MQAQHDLINLLLQVDRGLHDYLRAHLGSLRAQTGAGELTFVEMILLGQVSQEPGLTVSELARRMGMAKSHISKTVEGLVERGLLEKRTDPADQRLLRLHATGKVEGCRESMYAAIRQRYASLLEAVPEGQEPALAQGLEVLLETLERAKERGRGE